jgi:hypothetical protein
MIAIDLNGTIKAFSKLPKVWNDANGTHLNIIDGEAFGFYPVEIPSYSGSYQELGDIYFDSENSVFTYPVNAIIFEESIEDLKNSKILMLKEAYQAKLKVTDWYVVRAAEGGTAIPNAIAIERNNLRTECAQHEDKINTLVTKVEIVNYIF